LYLAYGREAIDGVAEPSVTVSSSSGSGVRQEMQSMIFGTLE